MKDGANNSEILLRVRNRMIEVLQLTSDFNAQTEYQRKVPVAQVPNEVINQWEDWYHHDPTILVDSVFTDEERRAVVEFDRVWNVVSDATPDPLPDLQTTQSLSQWHDLRDAARQALSTFMKRGMLPERP
jgi:hypothetical protein